VLGDDVEINIEARDETNATIPIRRIVRRFKRNGNVGLVCLVGVQTNQVPRAMDIAQELRAAGIKVAIGGFHVSGSIAMLPELTSDLREAVELAPADDILWAIGPLSTGSLIVRPGTCLRTLRVSFAVQMHGTSSSRRLAAQSSYDDISPNEFAGPASAVQMVGWGHPSWQCKSYDRDSLADEAV
jgi:hypothetical protein